jgi:hypothetical protein
MRPRCVLVDCKLGFLCTETGGWLRGSQEFVGAEETLCMAGLAGCISVL